MAIWIRKVLIAGAATLICTLFSGQAGAEPFVSKEWRFSANFPGQTQQSSQPVATAVGNVTMVSIGSEAGNDAFLVLISDFPKGLLAQQGSETTYKNMIQGAADSVKGTVRSVVPFALGYVSGRDVLIDVAQSNHVGHLRYFVVGDRVFQVMHYGSTGSENSKDALDFLNSFALTP